MVILHMKRKELSQSLSNLYANNCEELNVNLVSFSMIVYEYGK